MNFGDLNRYKPMIYSLMLKGIVVLVYMLLIAIVLYFPGPLSFFSSDKTINVYTFTEILSPDVIKEFEKREGVTVRVKYFETNEELLAKFRVNEGEGYDLVATISDYMVEILRKEGLLS